MFVVIAVAFDLDAVGRVVEVGDVIGWRGEASAKRRTAPPGMSPAPARR
jgi:hypothetical protein